MSFIAELKRRNVFRVGIAYLVVAWLILQVSDVILGNIEAPGWVFRVIMLMLSIGFPIILLFAWAFEMTPDGIKREKQVDPAETITAQTGQKLNGVIIGALILAVGYIAVDKFVLSGEDPAVIDGGVAVSADTLSAETAAAARSTNSIAVLPFTNRSANNENAEFFALGIQDELLTLLSQLGNLKVISRTSVERLDPNLTIPKIGALLGVATILEGQVQRAGDKVRINVQLIDTQKEGHLWASIYDRDLTAGNIFEIQSDIARSITEALHIQLSANDEAAIRAVPTKNTEAMNQYMLGQQQLGRGSFESYAKALEYFRRATELDAGYAQAWAAIAETANQMLQTGSIDESEYFSIAEGAVNNAMRLNNRLPAANAQFGTLSWRSGDLPTAEAAYQKALQLNPRDPDSLFAFGRYLRTTNRPKEAIPVFLKARETDPLSAELLFELGKSEMYSGNADKTIAYGQQILAINPSLTNGRVILLQAYLALGQYDLAWSWFMKTIESDPADFETWGHAGAFAGTLGDTELAARYISHALTIGPNKPAVLKCQVQLLASQGDGDEALAIARDALAAGLADRWGSDEFFLRLVRDDAINSSEFEQALSAYRKRYPELFQSSPMIGIDTVNSATNLVLLLQRAGKQAAANTLLDASFAWYQETGPDVVHGTLSNMVDVELLALRGDTQGALKALGEAIDGGWITDWRWYVAGHNLDSIRDTKEFKSLIAKLEAKMATQLEAIRELPNLGAADLR
jgi:TolB-like protein/Tfp pilus assembly protein PilF